MTDQGRISNPFPEDGKKLEKIYSKSFQEYADSLSETQIKKAIEPKDTVVCIDEGCVGIDGGWGLAGSGILFPEEEELVARLQKLKEYGLTKISSHDHCGAAGIAKKNQKFEGESDELGKIFAKRIAEKAGLEYVHIEGKDMTRPGDKHTARCAYLGATNDKADQSVACFSPVQADLPQGFFMSDVFGEPHLLAQLGVTLEIAFGHHGMGQELTTAMPFVLVATGRTKEEAERMQGIIETFLKGLVPPALESGKPDVKAALDAKRIRVETLVIK